MTLTIAAALNYAMPALSYGRNWINLTAGLGYQIDPSSAPMRTKYGTPMARQWRFGF